MGCAVINKRRTYNEDAFQILESPVCLVKLPTHISLTFFSHASLSRIMFSFNLTNATVHTSCVMTPTWLVLFVRNCYPKHLFRSFPFICTSTCVFVLCQTVQYYSWMDPVTVICPAMHVSLITFPLPWQEKCYFQNMSMCLQFTPQFYSSLRHASTRRWQIPG